ncbi:uncharacterized protein LOC131331348 [Rhododendron vialii]|uniref:uncharacterized protein LOC131331348 n=1 Tax=Rhododendron vialii TaxID=182163 RepID=UPI00265DD109|nr:uncharacterized protein LOC131331348 [Rhododendron vialii]
MQSVGSRDSGSGGRGRDFSRSRGRGRGRGSRSCTYCHGTNHTVDFCWILHGRPSAHQVTVSEDDGSVSVPSSIPRVVTIPEDEYHRLISQPPPYVPSSSTATSAQKGSTFAGLASNTPWVIDSGATDHMAGHSIHLSGSCPLVKSSSVALADGSSSDIARSPDGEEDWWRC